MDGEERPEESLFKPVISTWKEINKKTTEWYWTPWIDIADYMEGCIKDKEVQHMLCCAFFLPMAAIFIILVI